MQGINRTSTPKLQHRRKDIYSTRRVKLKKKSGGLFKRGAGMQGDIKHELVMVRSPVKHASHFTWYNLFQIAQYSSLL